MDAQLVYADIGPSSFKQQKTIMSSILELDDSRVEYAQLNYNTIHGHNEESNFLTDSEANCKLNGQVLITVNKS